VGFPPIARQITNPGGGCATNHILTDQPPGFADLPENMTTLPSEQSVGRPKLWFVCPSIGGLSEVWMYRQAVGLDRFSVRVLTNRRDNPERYPLPDDAVTVVPKFATARGFVGRLWRRARNVRRGFQVASPAELRWWAREMDAARPDVIFCQYGPVGAKLVEVAAPRGVPVITQFNGYDLSMALQRFAYRFALRRALPRMAGCVAVASYQVERLVSLGAARDRVRVISYGVPVAEFTAGADRDPAHCRFLAVGRFVAKKAPLNTIRAFAKCAQRVPGCELRMIGDGELLEQSRSLATELGVADRVVFLGAQPTEVVRREMAAASVFVQHSVTAASGDMEGWPVAVGEACASGLPVVATWHAGIVDQVVEGVSGFLVEENDWETMGERMIELAISPERRAAQSTAARRHIEQFDFHHQIDELETFLLECIEGPRVDDGANTSRR